MSKYTTLPSPRPRADDDYYSDPPRTMTVMVEDGAPIDTGLVDHLGVSIVRLSERVPMGFKR